MRERSSTDRRQVVLRVQDQAGVLAEFFTPMAAGSPTCWPDMPEDDVRVVGRVPAPRRRGPGAAHLTCSTGRPAGHDRAVDDWLRAFLDTPRGTGLAVIAVVLVVEAGSWPACCCPAAPQGAGPGWLSVNRGLPLPL